MPLIRAMSASESGGLPGFDSAFDLHLQTKRKTSRSQRSKVSGCTIIKASFHPRSLLARKTMTTGRAKSIWDAPPGD